MSTIIILMIIFAGLIVAGMLVGGLVDGTTPIERCITLLLLFIGSAGFMICFIIGIVLRISQGGGR